MPNRSIGTIHPSRLFDSTDSGDPNWHQRFRIDIHPKDLTSVDPDQRSDDAEHEDHRPERGLEPLRWPMPETSQRHSPQRATQRARLAQQVGDPQDPIDCHGRGPGQVEDHAGPRSTRSHVPTQRKKVRETLAEGKD